MEINMMGIFKMIKERERELSIIKMEQDMKEILKIIKEKERGFSFILMGIEKWEIILMGNKLENMLF